MRILILTTLLAFSSITWSQTLSLSLAEAQAKALETNRNAQISQLEIEKAERVVKETIATGLPQINAEGSFQHFLDIPTQVLPDFISPTVYNVLIDEGLVPDGSGGQPSFIPAQFGTEYTMSGGATLSQMIFNGSYLVGLKAAKSYVEMSELQKIKSDVDVREAVAESYHTALLAEENKEVLGESIITLEKILRDITAMYTEGFVEEQDVEQMQLTLNNLTSQYRNASRQQELTKQLLNFQIGIPLETIVLLTDNINTLTSDSSMDEMIGSASAIGTHPDLLIIDQGILLQELTLKEQKSRYLPRVNAFLSYSQQAQRNEFNFFESGDDWFPSTVWGVNLTLPIFSSGMRHQQVKQVEIDLKEIQLQRELAADGLRLATTQAKSNYLFAKENFQMEEENMALAGRIRDKTRIKYKEGLSSSFELNEIENQYLQAQGRKIQTSMSLLSSLNELKKAYNRL